MLGCVGLIHTLEIVAHYLNYGVNGDRLCGTYTFFFFQPASARFAAVMPLEEVPTQSSFVCLMDSNMVWWCGGGDGEETGAVLQQYIHDCIYLFDCLVGQNLYSKPPETLPLAEPELYPRQSCFQHENHPESTPSPTNRVQEPYRGRARFFQKLVFHRVTRPKFMFFMQNFKGFPMP